MKSWKSCEVPGGLIDSESDLNMEEVHHCTNIAKQIARRQYLTFSLVALIVSFYTIANSGSRMQKDDIKLI